MFSKFQVSPPSLEKYIGALPVLKTLLGVCADATMIRGLSVWTARKGSLSWYVSRLRLAGIRFTTLIWPDGRGGAGGGQAIPSSFRSASISDWASAIAF